MPVTVEEVTLPSIQDRDDLQKIYEDAPVWMLEHWQSPDHQCAIKQLLESVYDTAGRHLYAARFNNRLLAAIIVDKSDNSWLLHRLCVRRLTRGRGVGGRLLLQITERARQEGNSISVHDPEKQLPHERLQQTIGDYQLIEKVDIF